MMPLIQEPHLINDANVFAHGSGFSNSSENLTSSSNRDISPTHRPSLGLHNSNDSQQKISDNTSNSNKNSPLQLSSMLHTMSLSNEFQTQPQPQQKLECQGPYVLKLKNLPKDITLRECHAVFALAENFSNIELIKEENSEDQSIIVKFDSLVTASQYASILDSKANIFGPDYPFKTYVEIIDDPTGKQISYQLYAPNFQNYQLSSPDLVNLSNLQKSSVSSVAGNSFTTDRPKKSRFSFGDTFSNDFSLLSQTQLHQKENHIQSSTTSMHNQSSQQQKQHQQHQQKQQKQQHQQQQQQQQQQPQHQHQQQQQQQQQHQQHPIVQSSPQSFQNLSGTSQPQPRDVGKSFLLMENDEINDTIWGSNGIPFNVDEVQQNVQPSTPIFEWGSSSSRKQSNTFAMYPGVGGLQQHTPVVNQSNSAVQMSGISTEGFLPTPPNPQVPPYGMVQPVNPASQPLMSPLDNALPPAQQHSHIMPQPTYHSHDSIQQEAQINKSQAGTPQKVQPVRSNRSGQNMMNNQKNSSGTSISYNSMSGNGTISQADLSLLAKVPPPANPADQNPPCNTLYVGNLPSDATEHELRQLFSSQPGFRRLSFRNKNTNGNGHGPICFVEFEDVSFATRALAELYGSQLPSTNVSNKGGIRLSFSKNPLGVRGPNSRRNNSSTNINSNSNTNNYSYVSAYNKS
ncbi:hypothetical protein Kpol_1054p28 [Vanderwaltozyma polyspora DSM 70294]|uniref:RRM domain-containing protein n=1 Tax=Vanderwaltozyma polyspora (strain ATCC 22028 / DSM 70294 / BCRC 21397 / CBS 2163 / NBRC 10782 / NRRL Y-8283 / UCD 57-17) TaxID=436907 RepID=A7TIB5_VANPO|nr:uncharacterized protein Kpol_1054p28 [Vanderwaltozyma polyspora DSM 70294]EDO17981.1 hypothetical protein Kpol_1054p28 [Vanderwaltozyma polyspora DSM 70294]